MHRLLKKQVLRYFSDIENVNPKASQLLGSISSRYDETDRERKLIENALEVNSQELSEVNDQLRIRNQEFMQTMMNTLSEGVYAIDNDCNVIFINLSAENILRIREDEIKGHSISEIIHHSHPGIGSHDLDDCLLINACENGQQAEGEEYFIRSDKHYIPVAYRCNPLTRDGIRIGSLISFQDITDRIESEQTIRQLAYYDPLTSLPNRRMLIDRLKQAMATSARQQNYGAVIFIDLDHFKTVNDKYGHEYGDIVLREVASRLRSTLREGDTVARLGGDEFVVIFENLDNDKSRAANNAQIGGNKILELFNKTFKLKNEVHICTASIGIVIFHGHDESLEEILKRSDLAMYDAKNIGRNTLCFYDSKMQLEFNNRAKLENDLRNAISEEQFVLYFQKRVDERYAITGAEALIRWHHPETGIIFPNDFIPLSEQTGLIVPIGQWTMYEACRQLKAWEMDSRTKDIVLSVNLSATEFNQDDFIDFLKDIIRETGVNASCLEIEITESMLLENVEEVIQKMKTLTNLGISFSLDDFGTGYSSLSYLKKLPIHKLKVDQSFIRDIESDMNDEAIVNTIIQIGDALGLIVVAEGVENPAQRMKLLQLGCTNFQGYLFGKPVPLDEFEEDLISTDVTRLAR